MSTRLSREVALDQRNVLEDGLVLRVEIVSAIDLGHCIFSCELDVFELEEVADVEQAHCVMHANLWLWVTIVEVDAPVPELCSVHAELILESKVLVPKFAFKRSDVELELVVNLIWSEEGDVCICVFAKKRQIACSTFCCCLTSITDTAK